MKKTISLLSLFIFFYLVLIVPLTNYMRVKPFVEKVGYVPSVPVLKAVAVDHKELVGAFLVLKVLMYFGGLVDKQKNELPIPPDYPAMSRMIHGAVQLDPYNMDAYYFGQAILVWDVGKVDIANELLDYGMRYRTWDWYLPFFAGFNHAYFLKDYKAAANYYQRAGELSGSNLFKSLAGRYMQESGHTDLALAYLTAMEKGEKNPVIRKTYRIRIAAFKEVRRIEIARDKYKLTNGVLPATVDTLIKAGYLASQPIDPYGGKFYLEPDGKVATTSKFAFAAANRAGEKQQVQKDR
jgi:tetratricopeptide (TPR) repeat protein